MLAFGARSAHSLWLHSMGSLVSCEPALTLPGGEPLGALSRLDLEVQPLNAGHMIAVVLHLSHPLSSRPEHTLSTGPTLHAAAPTRVSASHLRFHTRLHPCVPVTNNPHAEFVYLSQESAVASMRSLDQLITLATKRQGGKELVRQAMEALQVRAVQRQTAICQCCMHACPLGVQATEVLQAAAATRGTSGTLGWDQG